MRVAPQLKAPSVARKPVWSCKAKAVLITRLFGGGARTREIDSVSWLRSSAAKSALRNWWRAAHAHDFLTLSALREREQFLFGAPGSFDKEGTLHGGPGPLEVTTESKLANPPVAYRESQSNPLNYALFPAQGMGQDPAKVALASDSSWATIDLSSPSGKADLHEIYLESLRLWLTLGGAGARTRRGAGALAIGTREEAMKLGLPCSLQDLEDYLRLVCQRKPVPDALDGVFCLARTRRIFIGRPEPTGEAAQKRVLSVLRDARQDRPPRGRSRWPEADAIRIKAGPRKSWAHSPDPSNADQYPRAALGLPIVVHYKTPPEEPEDHHILGYLPGQEDPKVERYSSPILLRPVRIWEGKAVKYVPVAIFTDCTLPKDLRPLVTTDPKAKANRADVVPSYEILAQSEGTLERIEKVFQEASGFYSL